MVGKNGYMPSMAFWFAGLSMMDRAVTIPTWAAAYEKGMEVYKNDEVAAVTYADRVVRQSQSAARPVDLAHVSSRQHLKIFTMFYGFFSSMLGTMRRTHAKAGKQMSDKEYAKATMALASAYLMNIILPAALEAIAKGKCGDDPDASDYLQCTLRSSTFFAAGFLPIVRDAMPFAYDMIIDDENYRSFGYSVTPIADTVEVGLRAFGEIKDIAEGDDVSLRTMVIGSGAIFGLPGVQTYRTLRGTEALLDGETDNPLAVLVGPPKK